jgi:signal transduction histidine kinase
VIESDQSSSPLRRGLVVLGVAVVAFYVIQKWLADILPLWAFASALVALGGWLAYSVLPSSWQRIRIAVLVVVVIAGGLAAAPTSGLMLVPAGSALLQVTRTLRVPLAGSLALLVAAAAAIPLGSLPVATSLLAVLSMEAALVLAFLAGLSRRQFLAAEAQSRELRERELVMREEQAKTATLEARQSVARDIHDLLAHSLGGLVIQLDAVEALLEAGSVESAAARIRDSRALAADGLREARRAVDALREVGDVEAVDPDDFAAGLFALVRAHESLGGAIDLVETGERRTVPAGLAMAVHRALQESLTNARKHAPGRRVAATVSWTEDEVVLIVENHLAAEPGARAGGHGKGGGAGGNRNGNGGGHGLTGMHERFAALPGGAATAGVDGDRFVVLVRGSIR